MTRKRTLYVITGKISANDVNLNGVVVVDMGECTHFGRQSRGGKKPVRISSDQLTCHKFKFADMKEAKSMGVPQGLASFTISKEMIGKFLTKLDKDDK